MMGDLMIAGRDAADMLIGLLLVDEHDNRES
jgi:hypothetical protein